MPAVAASGRVPQSPASDRVGAVAVAIMDVPARMSGAAAGEVVTVTVGCDRSVLCRVLVPARVGRSARGQMVAVAVERGRAVDSVQVIALVGRRARVVIVLAVTALVAVETRVARGAVACS